MKRKNLRDKKIKDAARALHALIWFREAAGREGKRRMVDEWNLLYPGAPVSLAGIYQLNRAERKNGIMNLV